MYRPYITEVCKLYQMMHLVFPPQKSLDDLLQHPQTYKEQWVGSVQVAMQQKQHHEHGAYLAKQQGMCRWLGLEET